MQNDVELLQKQQVFYYQFKIVNVIVQIDQTPIGNGVYANGDRLKVPLWYAELLCDNGFVEIEEFNKFEDRFIELISDQSINRMNIVKIPRDFYLQSYQYIKRLKNIAKKKAVTQLNSFISSRKKIITQMALLVESETLIDKMSLDEKCYFLNIQKDVNKVALPITELTKRVKEDGFNE